MAGKKVKIRIPLRSESEETMKFVGVNGSNTLIPKGVECEVAPEIKAEYDRSERAKETALQRKIEMARKSSEK